MRLVGTVVESTHEGASLKILALTRSLSNTYVQIVTRNIRNGENSAGKTAPHFRADARHAGDWTSKTDNIEPTRTEILSESLSLYTEQP